MPSSLNDSNKIALKCFCGADLIVNLDRSAKIQCRCGRNLIVNYDMIKGYWIAEGKK